MRYLLTIILVIQSFFSFSQCVNLPPVVDATAFGIKTDGSDQTAAINSILTNSTVTAMVFNVNASITINGTINCGNKIVQFYPGTTVKGTGTLNQAIIDALNYRQNIFDTLVQFSSCRTASKKLSVMWFGAKADGVTDDQPYLQKASDVAIKNTGFVRALYLPQGNYKINRSWILHNWNGSNYGQWNLNIIGEEEIQSANNSSNPRILPTFNDAPAIIVQFANGGYIKGLSIEGPSLTGVTQTQFYKFQYSDISSARNTQFSPNAGVCIDAFSSAPPADGGYPTLLPWYRGPAVRSGTTDFHLYQDRIQGFAVDVMYSPNGYTQQQEDCTIEHCDFNYANVAVAYGNTQSDHTALIDTRCWYYVYTVVDNVTYGSTGVGATIGRIQGMNIAGVVKRLFNISSAQKTLSVRDIYAENLYEFGTLMSVHDQVTLENAHINFAYLTTRPKYNASFANINVLGSTFKYYDDHYDKRMIFNNCFATRFVNCYFDQPPLVLTNQSPIVGFASSGPEFVDCQAFDPTISSVTTIGMHNDIYRLSNTTMVPILYGQFKVQDFTGLNSSDVSNNNNQVVPYSTVTYDYNSPGFNRFVRKIATNASLTIDTNARTTSFTTSNIGLCKVNDYCINNATGEVIGRITNIHDSTITLSEVTDINSSGTYTIDLIYYLTISRPFVGDITQGSDTIKNFVPIINAPYCRIGDRIEHPAFPLGTYIVNYINSSKIAILSSNATFTADRQNFANGNPTVKISSTKSPTNATFGFQFGFLGGTKWEELPNSTHKKSINYIFNKGGSVWASAYWQNPAEFYQDYQTRIVAGVEQYYDPSTDNWINL